MADNKKSSYNNKNKLGSIFRKEKARRAHDFFMAVFKLHYLANWLITVPNGYLFF
jgi:hypothetical protein